MTTLSLCWRALARPGRLVALSLLAAAASGCSSGNNTTGPIDEPDPEGAISIRTAISFFPHPPRGTFEVLTGSSLLGCSGGTFLDTPDDPLAISVVKALTCTAGGSGRFEIRFWPGEGRWIVAGATGDFTGLRGDGDFGLIHTGDGSTGVETFTGTIHFDR